MKLSIIVPIYNTEKFLVKCIKSILNESSVDYEIILVNDGSPDGSQKIIDYYESNYSQIKSICKSNGGLSSARNAGIKAASGQYITFVDSDDYVESNFISEFFDALDYDKSDLIISGVLKEELARNETVKYHFPKGDYHIQSEPAQQYLMDNDVLGSSFMHGKFFKLEIIRTSALKFIDVTPHEDTIFFLEFIQNCNQIKFIEFKGYHYVIHQRESLSKKLAPSVILFKISDRLLEIYTKLFKRLKHFNPDYKRRIVSEYGIDQRVIAWLDIYRNNRLNYSERISLMKKERVVYRGLAKSYGYKARRVKHQRFFNFLKSFYPTYLIDLSSKLLFAFKGF